MYCDKCGAEVSDDSKFCKHCGNDLSVKSKFCNVCGAEISDDSKFCAECGTEVTSIVDNNVEKESDPISNSSTTESIKEENLKEKKDSDEKIKTKSNSELKEKSKPDSDGVAKKPMAKNTKIIIALVVVILLLIVCAFAFISSQKPLEVTYENYPDIPKEVIDSFNDIDKDNNTYLLSSEYASLRSSTVWYDLEANGYVNHTCMFNGHETKGMDITDYNRAYKFEQKALKKDKEKKEAEQKKSEQEWEQAYQNWYSAHGRPSLSDAQNRQLFQQDVANRAYRMAGLGYGYGYGFY